MIEISIKSFVDIGAGIATIFSLIFVTYQYVKDKTNFRKKIYFQDMNPRVPKGYRLNPKDIEHSYNKAEFLYNFSIFNETKKSIKINEIVVKFLYKNKSFSNLLLKSSFEPKIIKPNEEFIFRLSEKYPKILHNLYENRNIFYKFKNVLIISYFYGNDYYSVNIPLGMTTFRTSPDFDEKYLRKDEYLYSISTNIYNQEYFNIHQFKNKTWYYQLYSGYKIGQHPKISKTTIFIGRFLDIISKKFDIKHQDIYDGILKLSENEKIDFLEEQM